VALVQYLPADGALSAHVRRLLGEDAVEDLPATEGLRAELVDYLEGRRARLDWPLDLRRMRSDFQRRVLEATAALPYGAVTSYAGIAARIGAPSAVRPVAQALRWNPLPIVIPCHRVIGGSGALTGYAGRRVELKQRLLAVEGVKTVAARNDFKVDREAMYTMVTGDREYCVPTCGSLLSKPLSELTLFGTRDRAEAAGFAPCTSCRPDLHPLPA
jgi:methylated-DNA-[protein]-cysteine S-methyltransferase